MTNNPLTPYMSIETYFVERIMVTGPMAEYDTAATYCEQHGFTMLEGSSKEENEHAIKRKQRKDNEYVIWAERRVTPLQV